MSQRTIVILSISLFVLGLVFGGMTLVAYLGMPVHELVFSTPQEIQPMDLICGVDTGIRTLLCRGSSTVYPFVVNTLQMMSPFWMYAFASVLLYLGVVLFFAYRTGYFALRFSARPILIVGLFALSVWLIGSTLAVGTLYNDRTPESQMIADEDGNLEYPPIRRFYEPTTQVYGGIGEEGLQELQANYQSLLSRGCLTQIGATQAGTKIYDLSFFCMQTSLFTRAGGQMVMVLLFLLNLLVIGRGILQLLRIGRMPLLAEAALSTGLGALGMIAILWLLSVLSILKQPLVLALFFGAPVALFWNTIYWAKASWFARFEVSEPVHSVTTLLFWLLISYLALNFLNVVRPFPIGWDDLGSYLNRPRLLASYGYFIPSVSQFQWEYLSSMGYMLFGFDSAFGSTFAMQINWAAGFLALAAVYVTGRLFFGKRGGLIAAMVYYFLPMTGHFSFADMKIDNAAFFSSALAVLALLLHLFGAPGADENDEDSPWRPSGMQMLMVAGLLAGLSFAIKPTAILTILMMLAMLSGRFLGPVAFAGMSFFGFGALAKFGALDLNQITQRLQSASVDRNIFLGLTFGVGIALVCVALYRKRDVARPYLLHLGVLVGSILVACLPWMTYNVVLSGEPSIDHALKAVDVTSPQIFYQQSDHPAKINIDERTPVRTLPPELKLDPNHAACKTSARTEELDRYWGFGTGWDHYIGLPWRQVMNIDSFGYYVTLAPILLLVPLLLLVPYFWSDRGRWLRLLFAGTMVFFLQWMFVGNGIIWYGIGMFLGLALAIEAFVRRAPDAHNRILYSILIAFSIFICLSNRMWQFDTQKNLFEYPLGKVTSTALREMTIPNYDDIRDSVETRHNSMPDRPYTYRIGTFISYFIPKNREILPLADHQLQFFTCLNQEKDHALTLKRLQALGFNSMIFDTNTQTIERDPNGSLHRKVAGFLQFANDPAVGLQIVVNDPGNGIAYILLP
jgi:hypothetical protein